jgi:hypothetical protein
MPAALWRRSARAFLVLLLTASLAAAVPSAAFADKPSERREEKSRPAAQADERPARPKPDKAAKPAPATKPAKAASGAHGVVTMRSECPPVGQRPLRRTGRLGHARQRNL